MSGPVTPDELLYASAETQIVDDSVYLAPAQLAPWLQALLAYLLTPRWRLIRRSRLLREARRLREVDE